MPKPRTLFDKIWDSHLVHRQDDGTCLIYIDRHLVHEVTSPQAFEGLRTAGRKVHRPQATLAVADHNVPTTDRSKGITEEESRIQVETLERNCRDFGIEYFSMTDIRQGIVHIIGPEQGMTQPGMTIVCGDSHTATHGAFGALAFGIGTSEVEHVLATQTLIQQPAKNMRVSVEGDLSLGLTAKDLILAIIGKIGTAGGTGHVIEYAGKAIRDLSMEGRMTVCNMSIEGGARAGMVAPDEKAYAYLKDRPKAPQGAAWRTWAFTIAHNLAMDRLRVSAREVAVESGDDGGEPLDWLMASLDRVAPSSEDLAFWRAAGAQLLHCLDALPAPQRAAFLLHHEDGASVEDLAQRLALPFETAKSRLRYAVRRLKLALSVADAPLERRA